MHIKLKGKLNTQRFITCDDHSPGDGGWSVLLESTRLLIDRVNSGCWLLPCETPLDRWNPKGGSLIWPEGLLSDVKGELFLLTPPFDTFAAKRLSRNRPVTFRKASCTFTNSPAIYTIQSQCNRYTKMSDFIYRLIWPSSRNHMWVKGSVW